MLLVLLILILLFGFGGYSFGNRWNAGYGPGVGLGTILAVCLVIWLLGGFGGFHSVLGAYDAHGWFVGRRGVESWTPVCALRPA